MRMVTDLDFGRNVFPTHAFLRSLYAKGNLKDGRMAWITVCTCIVFACFRRSFGHKINDKVKERRRTYGRDG